jgi:flagellar biosynthesis GTPase FlhF
LAAKITPRLIELTYEAALKSYWRRNALRKFLRASHVAESFIATWAEEESKRDVLDRLFQQLQQSDRGNALIFQMARSLSEQTTFPDLRNWEDSAQKIQDAHKAVQELKAYLNKQDEEIRTEKERKEAQERAREERAKIQRSLTDKAELQNRLDNLHSKVGTQEGGYAFQDWFYDFLDFSEITNRRPYNSGGRQIDGSLTLHGTTYLVELKFTGSQSDATDIDSLRSKVEDKADNTMGIMISISGYSSVAINGASGRRSTLILLDAQHIYMCLSGVLSFGDIISRVRRHASQTGESYLPVAKFNG